LLIYHLGLKKGGKLLIKILERWQATDKKAVLRRGKKDVGLGKQRVDTKLGWHDDDHHLGRLKSFPIKPRKKMSHDGPGLWAGNKVEVPQWVDGVMRHPNETALGQGGV